MGDVVALHAQRCLRQVECLRQLLQRLGALGEVTGAAGLVQAQGLLGVLAHRVHERGLVPALGHAQLHLRPAQARQPGCHGLGVGWQHRDQDLAGHGRGGGVGDVVNARGRLAAVLTQPPVLLGGDRACSRRWRGRGPVSHAEGGRGARAQRCTGLVVGRLNEVGVDLLEQALDQLGVGSVLHDVDHPAALTAHPASTDVEDLNSGGQLVTHEREDVRVGGVGQDDGVALDHLPQRCRVVAQAGRLLKVEGRGRRLHLGLHLAQVGSGAPGHEGAQVLGQGAVVVGGDASDARGRALVDITQQAGAPGGVGALEHAGRA